MTRLVIACGTDFSESARSAADVALAIAVANRSVLHLVHACRDPGDAEVQATMDGEAQRLRHAAPDVELNTLIASGLPDYVLLQLSDHLALEGPCLLVMGAVGHRGPTEDRLGPSVERTVQASPYPVLVVRDAASFLSPRGPEQKVEVVVADDLRIAPLWFTALESFLPASLRRTTLLHVTAIPPSDRRGGARLMAELRERAVHALPPHSDFNCLVVPSGASPAKAIADATESCGAKLLVLGVRKARSPQRLWAETVTRGALYRTTTNVLVIPDRTTESLGLNPPEDDSSTLPLALRLESHPFLRGLPGRLSALLEPITTAVECGADQLLFREGGNADALFLIETGRVALDLHSAGRSAVRLETLGPGSLLGLSWLFPPFRWHADARTLEPTSALRIDAVLFRELLDHEPAIEHVIARRLVRELYVRLEQSRLLNLDLFKGKEP